MYGTVRVVFMVAYVLITHVCGIGQGRVMEQDERKNHDECTENRLQEMMHGRI